MLNHITLMGRLTRDPELRRTGSGIAVASFTLAVDRDFGGRDGGERETDFVDIVAWRNTAEFVSKYFSKGRMAVVSGRLQIRNWNDKDGNKRRSAEVVADNIYFGDSRRDGDQSGNQGGYQGGFGGQQGGQSYGGNQGYNQNYGAPQGGQNYGAAPSYAPPAPPAPPAFNKAPQAGEFAMLDDNEDELPF